MLPRTPSRATVPSRATLRALRRLALAGSTVGIVGSACTVATISYEVNRRVHIAEQWVESKRNLQAACPKYDAQARMTTMAKMVEAAEAGEFMGLDSMRAKKEDTKTVSVPAEQNVPHTDRATLEVDSTQGASTSSSSRLQRPFDTPGIDPKHAPPQAPSCSKFNLRSRSLYKSSKGPSHAEVLLKEGNNIEATHHFVNHHPKEKSASDHSLAVKLFYANIQDNNISLAREIYQWMKRHDAVTTEVWTTLIERLSRRRNYDTLSQVYCDYATRFRLPEHLRCKVVKGLVDSYRVREAKDLVFAYLEEDRNCSMCALYLNELRKKIRNEELVETQFRKILVSFTQLGMRVTDRLFNPVLKTYVQAGYYEKAQELAKHMETTYKMPLGASHLGTLALGMALKSDWEAVDRMFQRIHALGKSKENDKWFRGAFDRIFLEYFLSHSGQEIRDFVFKAIEEYGLIPDHVLFEHIIMAYIQRGESNMVTELVETAKERSWEVRLDKVYFLNCLRTQRLNCEKATMGLWPMFRAAQRKFGRVTSSSRVLDFDKSSFPLADAFKLPHTGEETRWWRKAASIREPTKRIENYNSLEAQMIHHIHAGNLDVALELYQNAKYSGKVVKQVHVRLAVVASVLKNGATEEAKTILEEERNTLLGYNETTTPVLFKLLQGDDSFVSPAMFRRAVFHFYKILEERMLPIKHHILVSLSNTLIKKGNPLHALRLIRRVNNSKYGAEAPFDDAGLKAVSRACGTLGNMQGLRWVILTALKRDQFWGRDSLVEVQRVIAYLKSRVISLSGEAREKFTQEISYLQYLMESLERKLKLGDDPNRRYLQGDIESRTTTPLRLVFLGDANADGSATERLEPEGNKATVPKHISQATFELLQNWDERDELDKALAPEVLEPENRQVVEERGEEAEMREAAVQ